jgi:serine phosphatase RsbU (regulator of sigma subunit)/DNA-binding NarL/FixJ family response regulator
VTAQLGRILVVDDLEASRFVFASWLRRAGHEVEEAATGAEALALVTRSRFDVVLLDVHLPDMSGFDVCEQIKSSRATASIPVLHISATATDADSRTVGLNRGADGYLREPVEKDELLATVTALLRYHEARRESDRLAGQLEQLHQTALLIHAAPTLEELVSLAATGVTATFGADSTVLLTHNGRAWRGMARPNDLTARLTRLHPSAVLDVAGAIRADGRIDPIESAALPGLSGAADICGSSITTPRGENVGAVILGASLQNSQDELILDHLSQTLAVAVENHRLFDVEHQIASTLQHAMLPASLPDMQDVEVEVRYQSANTTVEIGGDFYEVLQLGARRCLLAVGDVVGHSLHAATTMAELRHSLRALASVGIATADLAPHLNDLLSASHPGITATVCIVELDFDAGVMRMSNAGHLPPVIVQGGTASFVHDHGPLLGFPTRVAPPLIEMELRPDTLIVLATDGLVERRGEDLDVGLERLRAAVDSHSGSLSGLCDRLLEQVSAGDDTFDDIAILAAYVPVGERSRPPG